MAQENGLAGKFQSFVSHFPGAANAPTLSFVVPAGTIWKGYITSFSRCAIADTPPIMNIQANGNVYAMVCYQGKTALGSDYSRTDYFELQAGTYTSAWEVLPSASGTNRVSAQGICYYL